MLDEKKRWRENGGYVTCLVSVPHSIVGSDSVNEHDSPLHSDDVVAVENAQQWGQKQKESIVRVRADLKRRIFFSRSRVGSGVGASFPLDCCRLCVVVCSQVLHPRQKLTLGCTITSELVS